MIRHRKPMPIHIDCEDGIVYRIKKDGELKPVTKQNSTGFIILFLNKRGIGVHRLIYEKYHNVKLTRNNCIIHIDGDKSNNKINNLKLTRRDYNYKNRQSNNSTSFSYRMTISYNKTISF